MYYERKAEKKEDIQRRRGLKLKKYKIAAAMLGICMVVICGGCSRETLNAQLAESLGTTGMYAGNEPVESPKMKAERELKEKESERYAKVTEKIAEAEKLAEMYDYEGALDILSNIEDEYQDAEEVVDAKIEYQQKLSKMTAYDGDIPHLYFQTLIADPARAFDGDGMASTYNWSNMTTGEFERILESLYENNYVLIDIHEAFGESKADDGTVSYYRATPMVPEGKKPIILSQDAVVYYDYLEEDGFASRLVLDENGEVKALYEDADGNELTGDYDFIPILESFIEEHPDFSLRNARGIIGLTGYAGAFGYRINDETSATLESDRETVKAIAEKLREDGWCFGSNTYSYSSMAAMTYDEITADTDSWLKEIGDYIGGADVLFYPYGDDVGFTGDAFDYLLEKGFKVFCGVWASADYLDVQSNYVHETRRGVDGYNLYYNEDSYKQFFNLSEILESSRPSWGE